MKKALIVVDIQNDFCENGSLEVVNAQYIIPFVNELMNVEDYSQIIFTQDFHPQNHISFAQNHIGKKVGDIIEVDGIEQVLWPVHCVEGTQGADFHKDLEVKYTYNVKKGTRSDVDSYSAFYDNLGEVDTGLGKYLRDKNIDIVEVVGLAFDFCVKYTCLDAVSLGFSTLLHLKGTKAVFPENIENIVKELSDKGVKIKRD